MENINFAFDLVLIATSFWMLRTLRGVGGVFGTALAVIVIGVIFLGFAHLIETVLFVFLKMDTDLNEFIHRLLVFTGFLGLIIGFKKIKRIQ